MSEDLKLEVNARGISFRTDDGHVTVFLKYLSLPETGQHVDLTLRMTPDDMERFAQSLLGKVQEARASIKPRH